MPVDQILLFGLFKRDAALTELFENVKCQVMNEGINTDLVGFFLHIDQDGDVATQDRSIHKVQEERRFTRASLPVQNDHGFCFCARQVISQKLDVLFSAKNIFWSCVGTPVEYEFGM